MTIAAFPGEVFTPPPDTAPGVPFDERGEVYRLARSESGVRFHKPACPDFRRHGWCDHMAAAAERAERPRVELCRDLRAVLDEWEAEGFSTSIALMADRIRTLTHPAIEAERLLELWRLRDGVPAADYGWLLT